MIKRRQPERETGLRLKGKEKRIFYFSAVFLFLLLSWLFFESFWPGILLSPLMVWLEKKVAAEQEQAKKRKWEQAFDRYLEELDSYIRLGHSLETAMIEGLEASDLLQADQWVARELEMNVSAADVFRALAEKYQVESLTHFVGVLDSTLKSGGNLHELMQNSMLQIRKRMKTETEIQSMLTKTKYESRILILFVPFLLFYLKSLSPNFRQVMYQSLQGRLVMSVCLIIYLLAASLCYTMTQIEI